jgi:hypothetical protein
MKRVQENKETLGNIPILLIILGSDETHVARWSKQSVHPSRKFVNILLIIN